MTDATELDDAAIRFLRDRLHRAHQMSCSDPTDPARQTTYSEARDVIDSLLAAYGEARADVQRQRSAMGQWRRLANERAALLDEAHERAAAAEARAGAAESDATEPGLDQLFTRPSDRQISEYLAGSFGPPHPEVEQILLDQGHRPAGPRLSESEQAAATAGLDYLVNIARGHDYADNDRINEASDAVADALDAFGIRHTTHQPATDTTEGPRS